MMRKKDGSCIKRKTSKDKIISFFAGLPVPRVFSPLLDSILNWFWNLVVGHVVLDDVHSNGNKRKGIKRNNRKFNSKILLF